MQKPANSSPPSVFPSVFVCRGGGGGGGGGGIALSLRVHFKIIHSI